MVPPDIAEATLVLCTIYDAHWVFSRAWRYIAVWRGCPVPRPLLVGPRCRGGSFGNSIAAAPLDTPLTGLLAPSPWRGVSSLAWRQLAPLHAFSGRRGAAAARPLVLGWLSCRRALRHASS